MQMIGRALRRIMRSTGGARTARVRPWIGVLLLAALTLGAAAPPAPRVCKLRGEIVLPDAEVAAVTGAPSVVAAHEHQDGMDGTPDPAVVSSCSSALAALPAAAVPTSVPDGAGGGALDHVTGFAVSHDPPPPFRPPRQS